METSISESADALPSAFTQCRYLPATAGRPARRVRSRNHIIRATAKDLSQTLKRSGADEDPVARAYFEHPKYINYPLQKAHEAHVKQGNTRQHLEKVIREADHIDNGLPLFTYYHPRAPSRLCVRDDDEEGRELAHSSIQLPSDRYRLIRRPTLEREDAFRDATTAKGKVRVRAPAPPSEDAEVAELYRAGLLYDNAADASETFNLNSIRHEEPLYSIRCAKPSRRSTKARGHAAGRLDLDLSFADLGEDDDIARYLTSPSFSDSSSTSGDEAIQHGSSQSSRTSAPLRVIYELTNSSPSYDVDTSQPPELILDTLSDYDYFSEGDLNDIPAQREVLAGTENAPSETWVMLGDDL